MNLTEAACFRLVREDNWFQERHFRAFLAVLKYGKSNLARLGFLLGEDFQVLAPDLDALVSVGAVNKRGAEFFVPDALAAVEKLIVSVEGRESCVVHNIAARKKSNEVKCRVHALS